MLDVNEMADGKDFYDVGSFSVSVNNQLAAFSEDIMEEESIPFCSKI